MKNIFVLTIALLLSISTSFATNESGDKPTSTSKAEEKNKTAEAKSNKTAVKTTTKVVSGTDLHKLKFPKKFKTKKPKYSFRK